MQRSVPDFLSSFLIVILIPFDRPPLTGLYLFVAPVL